ncbi:MAG: enoyl-CoA hydratase/isomerase family protein [Saprospiraceae bacterium]|nr:enoyl-CoA hydratase/isomerase family protein [Saprospiraceae bacterium]MCB9318354.1 enoyl-CoA hydratase/isomerase family protein [Lewinellaceae bacterium]
MKEGYVQTTAINDRVRRIEFFHPAHNALPGKLLAELEQAIKALENTPGIVAVLLTSAGDRTFCAGADFDELAAIRDEAGGFEFFSGFARIINACRTSSKLIIGRVQGKAVGGGVGLAAATDVCFATIESSVRLSELAIGIGPFVIGPAVERKTGKSAFSTMAWNPEQWFDAQWAKDQGLFQEIYQDISLMDQAITAYVAQIDRYHPAAIEALKIVNWEGTEHWDQLLADRARISGKLVLSDFVKHKIQSIQNKIKRQE